MKRSILSKKKIKYIIKEVQNYILCFPAKRSKTYKKYEGNELMQKISEHLEKELSNVFLPTKPTTVPDELTSILLESLYKHEKKQRNCIQKQYQEQKQTEMFIGGLLELYIQKEGFAKGWIYSGKLLDKVDFIRKEGENLWETLQIKNSDNTENSSAKTVRDGTKILMWNRRKSSKGTYFWDEFPDSDLKRNLSEKGFRKFIKNFYNKKEIKEELKNLKAW
jgi:hypothetical protein